MGDVCPVVFVFLNPKSVRRPRGEMDNCITGLAIGTRRIGALTNDENVREQSLKGNALELNRNAISSEIQSQ